MKAKLQEDVNHEGARGKAPLKCPPIIDQRKEPRRPAHGTVHIVRGDPQRNPQKDPREGPGSNADGQRHVRAEIVGRLIDISASGFRAAHGCATMTSGEVVGYSIAQTQGRARVVWTRVMTGANIESGFVVLAD